MKETKSDILDLLIEHELVIKRLYETFADQFPDRRDFWSRIAREEQGHASKLELLRQESTISGWLLIENRLKANAIATSINYIDDQRVNTETNPFSPVKALAIARDIESSLLERFFNRITDSIPNEIKPILKTIADESQQHLKSIAAALEAEKSK